MKSYALMFRDNSKEENLALCNQLKDGEADDYGASPLAAAIDSDDVDLVNYLLSKGHLVTTKAFLSSPIGAALSSSKTHSVEILEILLNALGTLKEEHPMDYCSELNEPMLHAAVRREDIGKVKLLLKHGANPNWYDLENQNAIDVAEELGNAELLQLLQHQG